MLLGDQVKDEDFNWAQFQELSSAPAQLESINVINAVGCQPGYCIKTNDAHKAYLQAYLEQPKDVITYVRLPRNRWPKWWVDKGYKDPVVPGIPTQADIGRSTASLC